MEEKKGKSFFEKLDRPNTLVFLLLPLILISLPIIHPLSLPFPVNEYSQRAWQTLKGLPEGSVVVMESLARPEYGDIYGPGLIAINKVLWSHNVKVVYYCLESRGVSVPMLQTIADANPEKFGKKYGQDYVVFGYVAGDEIGMASFAAGIRQAYSVDYYGNAIDSLPMMKNIKNAKDVALVITSNGYGDNVNWDVRQWGQNYNVPLIMVTIWGIVPTALVYYPRYIVGLVVDTEGGADMERLSGYLGLGTSLVDAKSLGGIFTFAIFLSGNVVMVGAKLSKRRRETKQ
jgi:hypothetical protein